MTKFVDQMEKPAPAPEIQPEMDPNMMMMMEGNAKLKEWFTKHPDEKSTAELSMDEKKEFILTYYTEEPNADEMLEKLQDEAEKIQDAEIQKGTIKAPFSQELILSTITIAKLKIMDDLVEEVGKYYEERRKLIKGKEINDPGVIKVTQLNCSKMAMSLQQKILQQVEEEAKSKNFPLNEFMDNCAMVCLSDVQSFVEIEKIYAFRKAEQSKDKPFDREGIVKYIEESLVMTKMIEEGKIDGSLVFIYPHLLSDKLFNLTGYESEEVVNQIRRAVQNGTIDEEIAQLIIKEAYAVERTRDSCQTNFDTQMLDYEKAMASEYQERMKHLQNIKDPLEDPAIKKLIEMGMISKEDAKGLLELGQQMQGGMHPGMFPPGMMPPGMMPPGMFPPGMMPPGMGMPPGMMPPGMGMPPGMMPPGMGMPPGMFPPEMMPTQEEFMEMMASGMFGPPGMFPPGMFPETGKKDKP